MTKHTNSEVSTLSGRTVYEHSENLLIDTFLNEHPKVKSIQFELDGSQFYEEIFNVIKHHDEPILDGSMFSHYMLCKKAHENGLKVVLSGSGGDEVFGGYESHSIGFMSDYLAKLKLRKFRKSFKKYLGFHKYSASWVASKIATEFIGQKWKSKLKSLKTPIIKVLNLESENEFFSSKCKSFTGSAFERSLKYQTVPPYLHYEDRNSMAFGVEIRVPFLDHKLVEYVAELKQDESLQLPPLEPKPTTVQQQKVKSPLKRPPMSAKPQSSGNKSPSLHANHQSEQPSSVKAGGLFSL
jgi:asparagine synthase (glutamine-hydrolysing)